MNYFKKQQQEWFAGGIFVYAEDNGIKVKVSDLPENEDDVTEKHIERVIKRIYKKLGLNWKLREIPGDYDPYNQVVRN